MAEDKDPWGTRALGQALSIATNMAAALLVGYLVGYYLDKWLGTKPWLTIIMFLLGMATGLKMMYEAAFGRMDNPSELKKIVNIRENFKKLQDVQQQLQEDTRRLKQEDWTEDFRSREKAEEDDQSPRS